MVCGEIRWSGDLWAMFKFTFKIKTFFCIEIERIISILLKWFGFPEFISIQRWNTEN